MCVCVWIHSLSYPACNVHVVCCHLWPVQLYNILPHFLINGTILGGKKLLSTKCVFLFPLQSLYEAFFILRRIKRGMIKNAYCSSCKTPVILYNYYKTWILSTNFWQILKYQISRKSVQGVLSCYMQMAGRTDMTKLIVPFLNFANPSKNSCNYL